LITQLRSCLERGSFAIDLTVGSGFFIIRAVPNWLTMRCAQCGADSIQGAAFCSRCGERLAAPRPAAVREYALSRIRPSWWHFSRELAVVLALLFGGIYLMSARQGWALGGLLLIALALTTAGLIAIARNYTNWSLTSDRLIERRGILASRRREMELADVRSIEVNRSLLQRMVGLGNVSIASAASTDFMIRLDDIPDPERVAEMLRQARLKRLA
jgi:membrane protein YdbS with pleckstrin-like domain